MSLDAKQGYVRQHRKPFQRKSQQQPEITVSSRDHSSLIWVSVILLSLGLMGGFFIVQHFIHKSQTQKTHEVIAKSVTAVKPQKTAVAINSSESVDEPIHYTFYEGLKKTEVIVEAEPISVALKNPHYILAGTFGTRKEALREQARLKRLGQVVSLNVVKLKKTYYRLSLGPFYDRLEMNKKRNELHNIGVDVLIVKRRAK